MFDFHTTNIVAVHDGLIWVGSSMKGFTSNNSVKECVFAVHLGGTATFA